MFLWFSYGFPIKSPFSYGFPMVFLWFFYELRFAMVIFPQLRWASLRAQDFAERFERGLARAMQQLRPFEAQNWGRILIWLYKIYGHRKTIGKP